MDVSIVISSYNQSAYLDKAIESALHQTHEPKEIIIVDDGSNDESADIAKKYRDEYSGVRTILHKNPHGIPQTFNAGFRQATGDAVTKLDGDDRFLPTKLEREVEALKSSPSNVRMAFSNFYLTDKGGNVIETWDKAGDISDGDIFEETFRRAFPNNAVFRNELIEYGVLEELDFFDEDLEIYEDWDFKIRATAEWETVYCPEPTIEYRQHAGGISKRSDKSLHIENISRIAAKNDHLLDENLSSTEADVIRQELSGEIERLKSISAIEERQVVEALIHYATYTTRYEGWSDLAYQLEFLLPQRAFAHVKDLHNRLGRD